jgi:ferredoxin
MSRSYSRGARTARILRQISAVFILAALVVAFLVPGDTANLLARAVSAWQFFPAADRAVYEVLSGFKVGGIAACISAIVILLATGLFGRWYCAALCPLGTLQDLTALIQGKGGQRYKRSFKPLRLAILLAVIVLSLLGAISIASWADPWSIFSRFFTYNLRPLIRLVHKEDLTGLSIVAMGLSGAAFMAILGASILSRRWFCGNFCPVGSVLGLLNSISFVRIRLDDRTCVSCGACASVCRAACIDVSKKRLDATRCVNCLSCLEVCPTKAFRYGGRGYRKTVSRDNTPVMNRAQFLSFFYRGAVTVSLLSILPVRAFPADRNQPYPVLPPGARSIDRFTRTCIACGLCVNRCPSKVLQPAPGLIEGKGFLVPRLDYSISYCQYDCTVCMEVCPSGALEKLNRDRKHLAKIGDASLVKTRCIVFTNGTKCGACAEHCPTGAVRMVVGETGLPEPVFTSSICIGCGACHYACPVHPLQAISVTGLSVQTIAEQPSLNLFDTTPQGNNPEGSEDAFPF